MCAVQQHAAVGADDVLNVRPRRLAQEFALLGAEHHDLDPPGAPISAGFQNGRLNFTF